MNDKEKKYYNKPKNFKPELYFLEGHKRSGKPRCTKWARTIGSQCSRFPVGMKEGGACMMHGGKKLSGAAHHRFKHGKYAKDYLPKHLQETFASLMAEPDLTAYNSEQIAVSAARTLDLIKRTESGESGELWRQALDIYDKLLKTDVSTPKGQQIFKQYLIDLGETINRGVADYTAWDEVKKSQLQTQKLAANEQSLKSAVGIDKVVYMLATVIKGYDDAIRKSLPEADARLIISIAQPEVGRIIDSGH